MTNGFIKIDRKILNWEWYKDINTCRLFIHCLLKANWTNGNFQGMEIKRGSFATSYRTLAEETNLTIKEVRTALKHLIDTGEIMVVSFKKFSVIVVKNFEIYQENNVEKKGTVKAKKGHSKRHSKGHSAEEQKSLENSGLNAEQETEGAQEGAQEGADDTSKKGNNIRNIYKNNNNIYISKDKTENDKKKPSEVDYEKIMDYYNTHCTSLGKIIKISEQRKKKIKKFITELTEEKLYKVFDKASESNYLSGKVVAWKASFDWLINPDNALKVLEGNYENKSTQASSPAGKKPFFNYEQREWDFEELERIKKQELIRDLKPKEELKVQETKPAKDEQPKTVAEQLLSELQEKWATGCDKQTEVKHG